MTENSVCIYNVLTKTGEIADQQYIVSLASTSKNISPTSPTALYTRSEADCDLNQELYFFDYTKNHWVNFSADKTKYPFATFAEGLNSADTNVG